MKGHVIPALGEHRLQELLTNPAILQRFFHGLETTGGRKGEGLAPKTVRNIGIAFGEALGGKRDSAVRKGYLPRNPMNDVDLPAAPRPDIEHWTADQATAFVRRLDAADPITTFVRLALDTGMRRGELCGLRWQHVDLEAGRLRVAETLTSVAYVPTTGRPKTKNSERTIELAPSTTAMLRATRKEQLSTEGFDDSGHVLQRAEGGPLHPGLVSDRFKRTVARTIKQTKIGDVPIPRLTVHGLRHTHAVVALERGVDVKPLSSRLGHASVAFTLDVYAAFIPKLDAAAAEPTAIVV